MPEHTGSNQVPANPAAPRTAGFWWRFWRFLQLLQLRLRFVAILAAVGTVIAFWDTLNGYYEKWTRKPENEEVAAADVEYYCPMHPFIIRDTPREKCPICHMDLSRRKKGQGDSDPLPPGTVSRVQLTPYREVLAGVQTTAIEYQPLVREITTFGSVEFDETREEHIAARLKGRIVTLHVNQTGQAVDQGQDLAEIDVRYSSELMSTLEDLLRAQQGQNREQEAQARRRLRLWDLTDKQVKELLHDGTVHSRLTISSPIQGHVIRKYQREGSFVDDGTPLYDVADLKTVWIQAQVYEADQSMIRLRQRARATTRSLPNEVFKGTLDFIYPHLDEASRTLSVRFVVEQTTEHKLRPGMYATVQITVDPDEMGLFDRSVREDLALENAIDELGHSLFHLAIPTPAGLAGMVRAAGRLATVQQGLVLAVPETAIIDTGSLKLVYRQAAANLYEAVLVDLGPRMTAPGNPLVLYPVLRGLQAGDHVVTNGSFLIDAETRLNPAVGSLYSGGGLRASPPSSNVRPSTPTDVNEEKTLANLARLSDKDRRAAQEQKYCVVTKARLGSPNMGVPVRLQIGDKVVFVCCEGCRDEALEAPDTLTRLEQLRARARAEAAAK